MSDIRFNRLIFAVNNVSQVNPKKLGNTPAANLSSQNSMYASEMYLKSNILTTMNPPSTSGKYHYIDSALRGGRFTDELLITYSGNNWQDGYEDGFYNCVGGYFKWYDG